MRTVWALKVEFQETKTTGGKGKKTKPLINLAAPPARLWRVTTVAGRRFLS